MSKLRHQKQFSHENEKRCGLTYTDRKKSKLASTELSAVTARPLLVPIFMPFTSCSNRVGRKTEFLDRGKNKGYISVVLWFLSRNYFLLARSFKIWTWLHIRNFFHLGRAVWVGISLLCLTALPLHEVYLPYFSCAHTRWHNWVQCRRKQLQSASPKTSSPIAHALRVAQWLHACSTDRLKLCFLLSFSPHLRLP